MGCCNYAGLTYADSNLIVAESEKLLDRLSGKRLGIEGERVRIEAQAQDCQHANTGEGSMGKHLGPPYTRRQPTCMRILGSSSLSVPE